VVALSRGGGGSGGASSGGGVLSELGADGEEGEGTALGGLDVVEGPGDNNNGGGAVFSFGNWEGGEVQLRSGWVDVKRGGASGGGAAGKGETDSEDEGEKVDSRVREGGGVGREGRGDGLVQLVEWIAALR
jgi:hypothetical protein